MTSKDITTRHTTGRELAEQHCNRGPFDCRWYHGNWYLLKSLDIVSTSAVHAQDISRLLLAALTARQQPDSTADILITGSTDETMVRLAHETCSHAGIDIRLHAVDICSTPLLFMQDYADNNDIALETYCSNILEFSSDQRFDIILTHAFMGYFDTGKRDKLVQRWRALLKHDGSIVTIQRVRPADSPELVRFTPEQRQRFIETATQRASQAIANPGNNAQYDMDMVKDAATRFAENFQSHAIRSREELETSFTGAGMVFERLEYSRMGAINAGSGNVTGPSVPSDAEFALIIARNPDTSRSQ
jgi:SAM-dependent methyltransferase